MDKNGWNLDINDYTKVYKIFFKLSFQVVKNKNLTNTKMLRLEKTSKYKRRPQILRQTGIEKIFLPSQNTFINVTFKGPSKDYRMIGRVYHKIKRVKW